MHHITHAHTPRSSPALPALPRLVWFLPCLAAPCHGPEPSNARARAPLHPSSWLSLVAAYPTHPQLPPGPRRFIVTRRCRLVSSLLQRRRNPIRRGASSKEAVPNSCSNSCSSAVDRSLQFYPGDLGSNPLGNIFRTAIFASVASMTVDPICHPLCTHTLSTPTLLPPQHHGPPRH